MKKYIWFSLTVIIGLIPISVKAETWDGEKISQMIGAMSWCTSNAAKNSSEASIYQSARRAGTIALEKAIINGDIDSNESLEALKKSEKEGKYFDQKLNSELCKQIWQTVNENPVF
ncbi:MAG: hypothetical protein F6K54_11070 [Okeania sp. SIO3B5]|uniref:hypothetical protein n=1 Tax=Okeania sp. SIO3B5 TaxID=2607811 RepID=UPI0013FF8264|nr:hypothetical protein [Okeania sp. SIO3B5]NEO53573.1 hypothetical protein [Okeania sp. SIO3B5]